MREKIGSLNFNNDEPIFSMKNFWSPTGLLLRVLSSPPEGLATLRKFKLSSKVPLFYQKKEKRKRKF